MIAGRPIIRAAVAGLVFAAFLFATSAPALWRMQCMISNKVVTAWVEAPVCMPSDTDHDTPTISSNCCLMSVATAGVDVFDASDQITLEKPFACTVPIVRAIAWHVVFVVPVRAASHDPPERLAAVSAFDLGQLRV